MDLVRFADYLFGLWHSPRKSVEEEPVLAVGRVQLLLDHPDHEVVIDEVAGVNHLLDVLTERRSLLYFGAEEISRRQMADREKLLHPVGLWKITRKIKLFRQIPIRRNF